MKRVVVVKTPQKEWPLDDIEDYMDLHGLHRMDEAIKKLNRENRVKRDPIRFFMRIAKSLVVIFGHISI